MPKKKKKPNKKMQAWIDARRRRHLSSAQVQMARELGMNPKKLGQKANDDQEPWKAPLPEFIEQLYLKRFSKARRDHVAEATPSNCLCVYSRRTDGTSFELHSCPFLSTEPVIPMCL